MSMNFPRLSETRLPDVTLDEFRLLLGKSLGTSPWIQVSQRMISRFAAVTGDNDLIHVDHAHAKSTTLGGTVAQGFLSLSLLPRLFRIADLPYPSGVKLRLNYGCNRLRFVSPVAAGSRIRGQFTLTAIKEKQPGQIQLTVDCIIEIEGAAKPAVIAQWITLLYF